MSSLSTSQLQKNPLIAFKTKQGYTRVTSRWKDVGLVLNSELWFHLLDSGILQAVREELAESHDDELRGVVKSSRMKNMKKSIDFDTFITQHGL